MTVFKNIAGIVVANPDTQLTTIVENLLTKLPSVLIKLEELSSNAEITFESSDKNNFSKCVKVSLIYGSK